MIFGGKYQALLCLLLMSMISDIATDQIYSGYGNPFAKLSNDYNRNIRIDVLVSTQKPFSRSPFLIFADHKRVKSELFFTAFWPVLKFIDHQNSFFSITNFSKKHLSRRF